MPSVAQLSAFAVTAFIIVVIPGPSVLFIIARGDGLWQRHRG